MKKPIYILLSFILFASFFACKDDFEDYTTNPQDVLTFSADTLRLDTILSSINTPVAGIMVYNNNSKTVLISSIRLNNAGSSGFRINVDGMAGSYFEEVEIRSKDSLYIFVDAKPEFTGHNLPMLITDQIEFVTNTVTQQVILEAYSQDVTILRGLEILRDTVLSNERPYLLYDTLRVREGATLQIREGTTFYMNGTANVVVEGTLKLKGTFEDPVVIRGDRMDYLTVTVPYDRVPGQWGGFIFTPTSFHNEIEYAHIRNGKNALYMEPSEPTNPKLTVRNSLITNFRGAILTAVNCSVRVENSELSNSKNALVHLIGGSYSFTHCTLANYYMSNAEAGWGNTSNPTLIMENSYIDITAENPEIETFPIEQADFTNTLIWGVSPAGTSGISIEDNEESYINLHFLNCLIPNDGENDDDFVNCLFATDPLFVKTDPVNKETEEEDFIYDFRITAESPAKDKANVAAAQSLPLDLKCISRLTDTGPDIGAYEYVPE